MEGPSTKRARRSHPLTFRSEGPLTTLWNTPDPLAHFRAGPALLVSNPEDMQFFALNDFAAIYCTNSAGTHAALQGSQKQVFWLTFDTGEAFFGELESQALSLRALNPNLHCIHVWPCSDGVQNIPHIGMLSTRVFQHVALPEEVFRQPELAAFYLALKGGFKDLWVVGFSERSRAQIEALYETLREQFGRFTVENLSGDERRRKN